MTHEYASAYMVYPTEAAVVSINISERKARPQAAFLLADKKICAAISEMIMINII